MYASDRLKPTKTVRIPAGGSTQEFDLYTLTDSNDVLIFQVIGAGALSVQFTPFYDDNATASYQVLDGQIQYVRPYDLVSAAQVQFSTTGATDGLVTFFVREEC